MTTTPENATTWRDLIDELTPSQREWLTALETDSSMNPAEVPLVALTVARDYVRQKVVDLALSDVPPPPGCCIAEGWVPSESGTYVRCLVWKDFDTEDDDVSVSIDGRQEQDGTFTRNISLYAGKSAQALTSGAARRLARTLLEAADELDERAEGGK